MNFDNFSRTNITLSPQSCLSKAMYSMTLVNPLKMETITLRGGQNTSRLSDGTESGNHLPVVAPSGVFPLFAKSDLQYFSS